MEKFVAPGFKRDIFYYKMLIGHSLYNLPVRATGGPHFVKVRPALSVVSAVLRFRRATPELPLRLSLVTF